MTIRGIWHEMKGSELPAKSTLSQAGNLAMSKFLELEGSREHLSVQRRTETFLQEDGKRKSMVMAQTVYPSSRPYKRSRIKALLIWAIQVAEGEEAYPPSGLFARKRIPK